MGSARRPAAATDQGLAHRAVPFSSDEEFLRATVPFVEAGLAQGEPVLAVTSDANVRLLRGALGSHAGAVEFADSRDWYRAPSWTMTAYRRYVDEHGGSSTRVRVVGEPIWSGRPGIEITEWARYESLINVVFAGTPVSILCPYDGRQVDPEILREAGRTHPELVTAEGTRSSPDYLDPAAFNAECDRREFPEPPSRVDEHRVTLDSLPRIRRLAQQEAARLGLPPHRAEDLTIAVNEVAANAITHGGGSGLLRLWGQNHTVVCEITNEAGHLADRFPGHLPPEEESARGRGLWMVRQLCELVQIRSRGGRGCTVRLHVYLP